ncbi:MAG TPA: GNAT family N-acetyltransferase [Ruminiclostridium sp.]|nr:GNAT family N-acetyltransferase [Ruminiclostridium sp.]
MQTIYYTERLLLKLVDKTAARQVLDYYSRNREFLKEWEPIRDDEFYSVSFHEEQLEKYMDQIKQGNSFRLWIYKKDDPDRTIGTVSFNNIVRGAFLSCHLGYGLDKDEINKGYMTEAVKRSIEIIFGEYGLHRIEANIMPKNLRSLKVVERLGFYNEGIAYNYLKINGKWEDHIHMVLLNDDV